MPDGLYERDALAWSEQQAELLRRLAAGERLNEAVDWDNLIEEVQDLGLSELRSVRSLLRQALVHLLKLHLSPQARSADHWRMEAVGFLTDAQDRFAASMRDRIDIQQVYRNALHALLGSRVHAAGQGEPNGRSLPPECPLSLDDLLTERPDIDALVSRLGGREIVPDGL